MAFSLYDSAKRNQLLLKNIDFGNGEIITCRIGGAEGVSAAYRKGIFIDIRHSGSRTYCAVKKETTAFLTYSFAKLDSKAFSIIDHCVRDITNGKFDRRKTLRQTVMETVQKRGLTSCMNNTKWQEFQNAMIDEMPFPPPYIYKTLFENAEGEYFDFSDDESGTGIYDTEEFAWNEYLTIEWVKVRPRYYTSGGGILCSKRVYHEADKEFVDILKKYSIPYETENGVYTIYGYR